MSIDIEYGLGHGAETLKARDCRLVHGRRVLVQLQGPAPWPSSLPQIGVATR